jgi:putative transposase
MLASLDLEKGEKYSFSVSGEVYIATFLKVKPDGNLVFKRQDSPSRCLFTRANFLTLRGNGHAVRVREGETGLCLPAIEPDAFLPITDADTKNEKARKKKYQKAVTQKYYVTCIDQLAISRSIRKIEKFIEEHRETHAKLGLSKAPGASTLIALCRECGHPGFRPIQLFLNGAGGDQQSGRWDQFILNRKASMIEMFYTHSTPLMQTAFAIGWFKGELAGERMRREAAKEASLERPSDSTVKRWLDIAGTPENQQKRLGKTTLHRQTGGIVPHLSAQRPLECVVMDHTEVDLHLVLLDESGTVIAETRRPWLILVVDVFTRMILAANLSWSSPSLETLMDGLKQTVRPKDFLAHLATSKSLAFACDGFGKFARMLVDNDLANVGQSMRMTAFSVGLDVSFAAVKNPESKSIVERTFGTLNTALWHQANGGVRARPGELKDEDPTKEARFTIDEAQEMLWEFIATVYHVEVHDGIEMAPARKWGEAYLLYRRPLIDDMRLIEEVFNKTEPRQLTRGGIRYEKEVFHEPDITSGLIRDLYRFNGKDLSGGKKNQSVSIMVRVAPLPNGDVSAIRLYNYARKTYVYLPNLNPEKRGTYAQAKVKRIANHQANEDFHPADMVDVSRAKILARLAPNQIPSSSAPLLPDANSSPHRISIHNAEKPMIVRKSVQRGVAARKANAAKANRESKQEAIRKLESRRKQPTRDAATDIYDKTEAAANILHAAPTQRFTAEEKAALQAAMKLRLDLENAGQNDGDAQ